MKLMAKNGRLVLNFEWLGIECEQDSGFAATPANIPLAYAFMSELDAKLANGHWDFAVANESAGPLPASSGTVGAHTLAVPLFSDFANLWFRERELEWRGSYRKSLRYTIDRCLMPHFGDRSMDTIDKASILAFRAEVASRPGLLNKAGLGAGRVNAIMMVLRMILDEAAERFRYTSPWRRISQLKTPVDDIVPFNLAQAEQLIKAFRADWRPYVECRLFTGLRTSEVNALRWQNVDFDKQQLRICEAAVNGVLGPCKNDYSNRLVKFPSRVGVALRRQQKRTGGSRLVFPAARGGYVNNHWFTNQLWYPTLEKLGFDRRRPYQTRHTCATLWLAAGENPQWIARQLGHADCEMLFRVYARYVPDTLVRDGLAFEQFLKNRAA